MNTPPFAPRMSPAVAGRPPRRRLRRVAIRVLAACTAFACGGCASWLPRSRADATSPFRSFDAARTAFEAVEPYRTTTEQLASLGFDVDTLPNMRQIPYPEVIGRLAPNASVPLESLDPGIRDCILSRQSCRAYEFSIGQQVRRREGSFLLDFLSFRRTTRVTGWRFEGLVVVKDRVVLFRNHGGEPHIERTERQTNPLGPLQQAGEAMGGLIKH